MYAPPAVLYILSKPPHSFVGRLLLIKPESFGEEIDYCFFGKGNSFRAEVIASYNPPHSTHLFKNCQR